jgi:hypothetical protein
VSRTAVALVAGLAGIGVGLFIADQYAQWKATSAANSILGKIGLSGLAPVIDPLVSGAVG